MPDPPQSQDDGEITAEGIDPELVSDESRPDSGEVSDEEDAADEDDDVIGVSDLP